MVAYKISEATLADAALLYVNLKLSQFIRK